MLVGFTTLPHLRFEILYLPLHGKPKPGLEKDLKTKMTINNTEVVVPSPFLPALRTPRIHAERKTLT